MNNNTTGPHSSVPKEVTERRARLYGEVIPPYEKLSEPIFTVWDDDDNCFLLPFSSFVCGLLQKDRVTLTFQTGTLIVIGPKTEEFCRCFAQHMATMLKADCVEIFSVRFIAKAGGAPQNSSDNEAGETGDEEGEDEAV